MNYFGPKHDTGLRSILRKLRLEREANVTTKLIARRQYRADRIYPAGSAVPEAAVGNRRAVLLRTHVLQEVPASQKVVVQPVDLPAPPPPPPKRPKVAKCIVRLADPIASVRESLKEARKFFANDSDALLFLQTSSEFCQIYKLAVQLAVAEKKAKHKGAMQSVTPDMVGF
jgi:hypothetical protein